MLLSLHVKNFAIIDETEIEFQPNLNVMTGETGSGKSILIGSINSALGGKISREMIRQDAEYAYVELVFDYGSWGCDEAGVHNEAFRCEVNAIFDKYELPMEEEQIIISRRIMANGRSIVKVNGETSTQAAVKELAEVLLDIHGQHEHQSLLYKKNHLLILDRYAKSKEDRALSEVKRCFTVYMACKKELEDASVDAEGRQREISLLDYECNEIRAAQLKSGEKEGLTQRYKVLSNQKQIQEALGSCYRLMEEDESSVSANVEYAVRNLSKVSVLDEQLEQLHIQLTDIESMVNDFNRALSGYMGDSEEDSEENLAMITERLDLIHRLEAKYGNGEEQILSYLQNAEEKLDKLMNFDSYLTKLKQKLSEAESELIVYSEQLGVIRRGEAKKLEIEIKEALLELNFMQVEFCIRITNTGIYSASGTEEAEFLISLNPGEPLQPLAKVASGGELSRIMLGIKSVLADKDEIDTLIFDEIDTGISGRTAQKVAERLAVIAEHHQVICISHLPQIAAMADHHYRIEKLTDGQRTRTEIMQIGETDSIEEIGRLLGGVKITDSVLSNAKEMKQLAEETRQRLRARN